MSSYQTYNYNDYKSNQQETAQPKNKNKVRESMISMMSQAFEFQDFLGQTTTMKDRVPKNKNNTGKTIVHFSRDVGEQYPTKNALQTQAIPVNLKRQSTFDMCMENLSYTTPKVEYNPKQLQNKYGFSYFSSYNQENVGNYNFDSYLKTDYTSDYLNFTPKTYDTLTGKTSSNGSQQFQSYNYQSYDKMIQSPAFTKAQNQYNYTSYIPESKYSYEAVEVQTPTFQNSMTWDSVSQQQNSKPTDFGTTLTDKKYDVYGEYAKDFSGSDILAIMNKRSKVMGQNTNYSNNYNSNYNYSY